MFRAQYVLVVVALYVGVVHSWDIAISIKHQLIFYTNGIKTSTVNLNSRNPTSLVYDEVHNMMLYVDKQNSNDAICGYDLSSVANKDNKCFIKRNGRNIHSLAFDPVTEKIFFTDTNEKSINFISKKRGSNNNIYGEQLIKMDDQAPANIAVDSCKGYIYWTHTNTDGKIEKIQFDGSDRKVISLPRSYYKPFSLTIDPQIQKMIYFDVCGGCGNWDGYLNKADLNGTNEKILLSGFYGTQSQSRVLTVSKDYIYWMNSSENYDSIWQLPKKEANNAIQPKEISKFHNERILGIVAKYKIEDQIKGIQDCDSLASLIPTIPVAPDHAGELCNVPVCTNYCLQGNCSVNDEGLPECSCNAGFTGGRCEVSVCHGFCLNDGNCSLNDTREPVCQCKGDYSGERCEKTDCLNYCMRGNCSFNYEGHPTCSCTTGYSGDRCEVSTCHGFCLNDGTCSLNENGEPVCQCKGDYSGDRCEKTNCLNYCMQGSCSLNSDGLPKCSCNVGYSGERCEVSACYGFCLNNGECSLNEEDEPACQCVGNHEGARCEAVINDTVINETTYDLAKRNLTLVDILSIWRKPSSKMYVIVEV